MSSGSNVRPGHKVVTKGSLEARKARMGVLFTAPWIIGLLLFYAYPLLSSIYYSFTSYSVLNSGNFVGLENYRELIKDNLDVYKRQTMHGASKGKDVKLRKEIATAIRECLSHEGIFGALVSHLSLIHIYYHHRYHWNYK